MLDLWVKLISRARSRPVVPFSMVCRCAAAALLPPCLPSLPPFMFNCLLRQVPCMFAGFPKCPLLFPCLRILSGWSPFMFLWVLIPGSGSGFPLATSKLVSVHVTLFAKPVSLHVSPIPKFLSHFVDRSSSFICFLSLFAFIWIGLFVLLCCPSWSSFILFSRDVATINSLQ